MTTRLQELAAEAVRTWGADKQLRQLTEECGECIAAVNQRERGRIGDLALAVELADVAIMLEQAKLVVGVDVFEAQLAQQLNKLAYALQGEHAARLVEPMHAVAKPPLISDEGIIAWLSGGGHSKAARDYRACPDEDTTFTDFIADVIRTRRLP